MLESIEIIRKHTNKRFSISFDVNDLLEIQKKYQLPDKINGDNPCSWCAFVLYQYIAGWLREHSGSKDKIEIIFERGDLGQSGFRKRFVEIYPQIEPPIFKDKKLAQLQAADMLAYESRKSVIRKSRKLDMRQSFVQMQRLLSFRVEHYSLDRLTALCEKKGFSAILS